MTIRITRGAWDTISTLCFNRKVLYVGVNDGYDVLSVAQVARIVLACPVTDGADRGRELALAQTVIASAQAGGLESSTLVACEPYTAVAAMYASGGFDVAVVNLQVLDSDNLDKELEAIAATARYLIVIEPAASDVWDLVEAATLGAGMRLVRADGLIVASPVPTAPIVRND